MGYLTNECLNHRPQDWDRAYANAISWDVVAGHSSAKTALLQVARETLNAQEICPSKSIQGVILSGPSGSGKSSLGRALAAKLQAHLEYVPCATLLGSSIRKLQHALGDVVEAAIMEAPSVLLFDDLDALLTDRIDTQTEEDSERVRAAMLTFFTKLSRRGAAVSHLNVSGIATVLVIATTRQRRIVDDVLGASGFFDREIALEMPNTAERLAVLETLVTATDPSSQSVLTTVAEQTRGFSPADLTALWRRATLAAYERQRIQSSVNETSSEPVLSQPELSCMDWREALAIVRPSSLPDWTLERPRTRWSDIGGQEQAKRILMETLVLMQQHTAELERLGFRVPRGILLYGPPGCSKTLLARAAAAESGLLMLMVRGPELFNKYVGESEKAVQRVFQRARAAAPSLLFFDEIDALATNRSRTSSDGAAGAEERVLAQLLTELDGVEPLRDVVVVAATNRPDLLDAALLRPGRFDRLVYVGLPDTNERRNILRIHLRNVPLAASCSRDQTNVSPEAETLKDGLESACSSDSAFRETLYARLAAATQGFTGAEIAACVREACLLAMEQDPAGAAWVYPQHLEAALQRVRPRTDASLLRLYKQFGASLRTCP
ncbi:Spermatoproteinsis associated protein 5 [Cyanidiococcus yangmingshanensis]|uniref:Spermatoproteinsis associated protein 5 n=1 Tax=Cyanidiococcus yangmingshanensis TaxID=2690220 RepID=A0A7J7ICK2_9RHOD|nr:Spermatoproteinsis associated protein 5 [Cyanidiococcus yangmingshanensis]